MAFTTSDLIISIKSKALIPNNQNTFTPESLLSIADEELQTAIVPMIMNAREEYFSTYMEYDVVAEQDDYYIPTRAIGGKLDDVTFFNNITVATPGPRTGEYSLPFLNADMAPYRNTDYSMFDYKCFFVRGNKVHIRPIPTGAQGVLRLYYFQRPNKLVEVNDAARIDSINTATNEVTVNIVPSTFAIGTVVDIVKAKPGFDNLAIDQTITNINGLIITFASLPTDLVNGDYVALAGETPVPQVPVEFHGVLAQRVAVKVLEAIGDQAGSALARTKLQEIEQRIITLIAPRVEGEVKKIINPFGPLNTVGRSNRWNGY